VREVPGLILGNGKGCYVLFCYCCFVVAAAAVVVVVIVVVVVVVVVFLMFVQKHIMCHQIVQFLLHLFSILNILQDL